MHTKTSAACLMLSSIAMDIQLRLWTYIIGLKEFVGNAYINCFEREVPLVQTDALEVLTGKVCSFSYLRGSGPPCFTCCSTNKIITAD